MGFLPASIPIGVMVDWAGSGDPDTSWLLCDGRSLNSTTNTQYAPLFAVIGTTYGGTGAAAFSLPDLRGRTAVGPDTMATAQGAASRLTTSGARGNSAGAASHSHTVNSHRHNFTIGLFDNNYSATGANSGMGGTSFNSGDRAGAYSYASGVFTGSTSTAVINQTRNGSGTSAVGSMTRMESTGDTDVSAPGTSAPTNSSMPPFQVVNKIIKVL